MKHQCLMGTAFFLFYCLSVVNGAILPHGAGQFSGLTAGLISLIRPTNTIVLILIPLYSVYSFQSFKASLQQIMKNWPKLIIMAIFFIIVWIPQFLYWKKVSGNTFISHTVRLTAHSSGVLLK